MLDLHVHDVDYMLYPADGEAYVPALPKQCDVSSGVSGGNLSGLGGYYNELYYFLDCINKKRKPVKAPFIDGAEAIKFIEKEKSKL